MVDTAKKCPIDYKTIFGKKDADSKKLRRKFPWVAVGGLSLVTLSILAVIYLGFAVVFRYYYLGWSVFTTLLKITWTILYTLLWIPIKLGAHLFSLSKSYSASRTSTGYSAATTSALTCNNAMELQGWEVLTLIPGSDGNPAPVKYSLNAPTPHAVSIVDIDYRDTRLDIVSNGKYYGSTSDFALNKTEFCGQDLNACVAQGFSTGTVIIPGGKQAVEIVWSGKDVFPGTDKIVWGSDRKRRVMWKKELCI